MEFTEVELKYPLKNPDKTISWLDAYAKKSGEKYQKDTYYIPAHRDFTKMTPISEWLRLRESEKNTINYKHWHNKVTNDANSCDEYQCEVDIKVMTKILEALDFQKIVVVEKNRQTWRYKKAEIAIDKVTGLGDFIELEAKEFSDIEQAKEHLFKLIEEIDADIGELDTKGYPWHLLSSG